MKIVVLTLLFILSTSLASSKERSNIVKKEIFEKQRWNQILKLIDEEVRTINMAKKKSQKLMYRLFELKSEKIKLFKEKENKEFVAKKAKYGKKVTRKNAFQKTLKLYKDAHQYGTYLLKKYPRTRYKAAIYYTLALNARDFSYDNKEHGYLLKAIKFSKNQKKLNYLATTSLAEYYYNNKKYSLAVKNYKKIIGNRDDEWLTKNLYNYGWCLLKTHKFNAAINRLEEGYKLSPDEFYVDMREQIINSLISFYVYGKEIQRGILFIDTNAQDKEESLLKLAQKSSGKGFFKETEQILADLVKRVTQEKKPKLYTDMRLFQFDLYTQYHKSNKLLSIGKKLPTLELDEYQREETVRKISEVVGARQIILKKDFSKQDKSYDKKILSEVVTYFDILSKINSKEKAQYEFFKGETYYSVNLFPYALSSYKKALKNYDNVKSKNDLRAQSMDAIFSSIELIKLNPKAKKDELEFAYNKYLSYWPSDSKAQEIYPRLFSLYLSKKNYSEMQKTIDQYITYFPKDQKQQRELYRSQLDSLIKTERTKLLAAKINKLRSGYLNFEDIEIKKSETILANILFTQFQNLNKKGRTDEALNGYKLVHSTKFYPQSVKAEAAFNIGVLYTDTFKHNLALRWYQKSFELYTRSEREEKREFLEKMALRTELLQDFSYSAQINKFILTHFCSDQEKNQPIFVKAIQNDLITNSTSSVMKTIKQKTKCAQSFTKELKEEILAHFYDNKDETKLIKFIDQFKVTNILKEQVSQYYEKLFWSYYKTNLKKQQKYFSRLKRITDEERSTLLVSALSDYKELQKKIHKFNQSIIITTEIKDPSLFSTKLQTRLQGLQPILKEAEAIFKLGHGQVSVLVFDKLTKLTKELALEIKSYKLDIEDQDFQKQFSGQMHALAQNISNENLKYKKQSQDLIEKYEILIAHREDSHPSNDIINVTDIRSPASVLGITSGHGSN